MSGKRLELTEEERAVMVEALKFWKRRAAETCQGGEVAAVLVERINAPDDPMEQFFSQQAMDAVKAGQCGVLKEDGEVWGALVPAPVYRLVKRLQASLGDWVGAWTVVRLPDLREETDAVGAAVPAAEAGTG